MIFIRFEIYSVVQSSVGWMRTMGEVLNLPSAKNISVPVEWLSQSGRALSEPSDTPCWEITARPASIQRVAFHLAL